VQHGANGSGRPVQDLRNLLYGDRGDQIKKALLFGLCPFAIRAFLIYAKLAQET